MTGHPSWVELRDEVARLKGENADLRTALESMRDARVGVRAARIAAALGCDLNEDAILATIRDAKAELERLSTASVGIVESMLMVEHERDAYRTEVAELVVERNTMASKLHEARAAVRGLVDINLETADELRRLREVKP